VGYYIKDSYIFMFLFNMTEALMYNIIFV
jgi:hypothetical protein